MLQTLPWKEGDPEVLPGATGSEIGVVPMRKLVRGYGRPMDAVQEWAWLARNACLEGKADCKPDYVVRVDSVRPDEAPATLKRALLQAREQSLVYLCIHHAAQPQLMAH